MKDPISAWANEAQKRENAKQQYNTKNRSLIDDGLDAIYDIEQITIYIDERLKELRKDVDTYVGDIYDPTVIARYDELTKIKHLINKLNQ